MKYQLTQRVAPSLEPITLADAKSYLRLDDTAEDALVSDLIVAARQGVECATGRSLLQQDWQIEACLPEDGFLLLPRGPVGALLSVESVNEAGGGKPPLPPRITNWRFMTVCACGTAHHRRGCG